MFVAYIYAEATVIKWVGGLGFCYGVLPPFGSNWETGSFSSIPSNRYKYDYPPFLVRSQKQYFTRYRISITCLSKHNSILTWHPVLINS